MCSRFFWAFSLQVAYTLHSHWDQLHKLNLMKGCHMDYSLMGSWELQLQRQDHDVVTFASDHKVVDGQQLRPHRWPPVTKPTAKGTTGNTNKKRVCALCPRAAVKKSALFYPTFSVASPSVLENRQPLRLLWHLQTVGRYLGRLEVCHRLWNGETA